MAVAAVSNEVVESLFSRATRRRAEIADHQKSNIPDLELRAKKCLVNLHGTLQRRENDSVVIRGFLANSLSETKWYSPTHRAIAIVQKLAHADKPEDIPARETYWDSACRASDRDLLEELLFLEEARLITLQLHDPTIRKINSLDQLKYVNLTDEGKQQARKVGSEVYPVLYYKP